MYNVFVFDFIITSLFHHGHVMMSSFWGVKNDIFAHESKKCSKYEKFNLFLRQIHSKYSETLFKVKSYGLI